MSSSNLSFGKNNFFYSANSEHYQDAFLLYIFLNYPKDSNCNSEIERFSKFFMKKLLKDINITAIDVYTP